MSRILIVVAVAVAMIWAIPNHSHQRLANGNTLITESDGGRAFEVTPDGEIVWEFCNPARAGKQGELIATLYALKRLDPSVALGWSSAGAHAE